MRNVLVTALLALSTLGLFAQKSKIPELPSGTLSGNVYTNDAVGLTVEFPREWHVVTGQQWHVATYSLDGAHLDPIHHDYQGLADQCSKVLLLLNAPGVAKEQFASFAALLAIDPACFSSEAFPQSTDQEERILKLVEKVGLAFVDTPFIPPTQVRVQASTAQGRVVITTTDMTPVAIMNDENGRPSTTEPPLECHTLFAFTESKGYWVAWAYLADKASAEQLKKVRAVFKDSSTLPALFPFERELTHPD